MNIAQLLLILRARRATIFWTLGITVLLTIILCLVLPKSYKATTSIVLNYKGMDPVTGMALPAQLMPGYTATQVDIINSRTVALKVVKKLKLADNSTVKENFMDDTDGVGDIHDWLADILLKKLSITPSHESSVVELSYKGASPEFAAAVANAFAEGYLETTIELKLDPSKKAAQYFGSQVDALRQKLEDTQKKLSKYQQDNGLYSVDNRLDVETSRLNDLSSQLVVAQGQAMEATSRRHMVRAGSAGESPDVLSSPLIQNLKAELGTAESKFSDIAQRLDKNHPDYQGAKAQVEKLRADLNAQLSATANSVSNNAEILQQRENEIRVALDAQKKKVLDLNRARDEVAVLSKEIDSTQHAYDTTTQRMTDTSLEGQSNQSDVAILSPATPPLVPNNPKTVLYTILSIFMGTMMGMSLAMLRELIDRRVRAASDLADAIQVPVMGVIAWDQPKRPRFKFLRLRSRRPRLT